MPYLVTGDGTGLLGYENLRDALFIDNDKRLIGGQHAVVIGDDRDTALSCFCLFSLRTDKQDGGATVVLRLQEEGFLLLSL